MLAPTNMESSHPPSDGFLPSKMVTHCQCGWQPGSVFAGPPVCMNSEQNEGFFFVSHHAFTRPARAKWTVFPMPSNPTALPQARRPKEEKASSTFPGDLPFFPRTFSSAKWRHLVSGVATSRTSKSLSSHKNCLIRGCSQSSSSNGSPSYPKKACFSLSISTTQTRLSLCPCLLNRKEEPTTTTEQSESVRSQEE